MALALGFSCGHNPFDLTIQAVEVGLRHHIDAPRPLCNHTWLEIDAPNMPAEGAEAVWSGTRRFFAATKDVTGETVRRYAIPCSSDQERVVWQAATFAVQRGTPYNRAGLLKALWYVATGRRADSFSRDPAASEFCSQFVTNCLRSARIPVEMEEPSAATGLLVGVPADAITPCRLEMWARDHGTLIA